MKFSGFHNFVIYFLKIATHYTIDIYNQFYIDIN